MSSCPSADEFIYNPVSLNCILLSVPMVVAASMLTAPSMSTTSRFVVPSTSMLPEISRDAAAISPENVELSSAVIAPTCNGA